MERRGGGVYRAYGIRGLVLKNVNRKEKRQFGKEGKDKGVRKNVTATSGLRRQFVDEQWYLKRVIQAQLDERRTLKTRNDEGQEC